MLGLQLLSSQQKENFQLRHAGGCPDRTSFRESELAASVPEATWKNLLGTFLSPGGKLADYLLHMTIKWEVLKRKHKAAAAKSSIQML